MSCSSATRRRYVVLAAIALATLPYFVAKERTAKPYLAAGVVILVVCIFVIPPLILLPVRVLERTLREK